MFGTIAYDAQTLERSREMAPVQGTVAVDIPAEVLWRCFTRADEWPRWNRCMFWAANGDLKRGDQLVWAFEPLRWWLPYKLPGIAKLVEVEPGRRVTWEVTAVPGFFARHSYTVEDLGEGRSRFGSWEKAMGPSFRLLDRFWLAHFEFVKDRSLQGARLLEQIYRTQGHLDSLPRRSPWQPVREVVRAAGLLRLQYEQIVEGVYAVLGGGGNTLVVHDDGEVLVVDPKMPPFAQRLKKWIGETFDAPVTTVVNTHFHYDHTQGNHLFPGARIVAQAQAPWLMQLRDTDWWEEHPSGMPTAGDLVTDVRQLMIGKQAVQVRAGGQGHTATDLWVTLERAGQPIIATGDVASLSVYPFFDLGEGGADVPHMITRLRQWAADYPDAVFVPGHGPVATAADLVAHGSFQEFLYNSVAECRAAGLSEEETIRNIDLAFFDLFIVPMFHYEHLALSRRSNIRAIYRLQERGM